MRIRPRFRLIPVALAGWLAAGIAIGIPDAAPAFFAVVAMGAVGATVAAFRVRLLVLPGLALGVAALVLGSVSVGSASRTSSELDATAEGGRSLMVEVVVEGRASEGRFAGRIDGTAVPVLVFAEAGTAPPIGAVVRLRADVEPADAGDDVAYLLFAQGEVDQTGDPPPLLAWADGIRSSFLEASRALPDPGGSLLPGLAIGETSRVPEQLDAAMKSASLSHLTAVSGANCAIVVGAALAVAALLGARLPMRLAIAAVALAGFVVLVTPEPSVLRAAVMAGLALGAVALGRPALGVPVLCAAVLVLLIADPWLSCSYGFALSVLATAGLLLLAGPLAAALTRLLPAGLATVISIPIAAQLACQPVLLLLDPSLPLYGIPANLLAAPAAPVATVVGLLACLITPVAPPVGLALAWIGWLPAAWIAAVAELFAGLPGARGVWPSGVGGVALLVFIEGAALVALVGSGRSRRWARATCAIAVIAYAATVVGSAVVTHVGRPADWQYAMCDVGQGDATVVRSGDRIAVVDVGPDPAPLRTCLDDLGIGRIDLLVLTHFDLDHVGGADAVVGRVDRVLTGPTDGADNERLLARLEAGGATVDHVETGDGGVLGTLNWEVLWPPPSGVEPGNPASVTLYWSCEGSAHGGCLTAIMLGDLGEESQVRMMGRDDPGPVDVVKVSHHGSADQSAALYDRLQATVGLIGVGAGNDYGHPTDSLLGILAASGTTALRTDLEGLILIAPGDRPGEVDVWTAR
jgi:competence protein ComEC